MRLAVFTQQYYDTVPKEKARLRWPGTFWESLGLKKKEGGAYVSTSFPTCNFVVLRKKG